LRYPKVTADATCPKPQQSSRFDEIITLDGHQLDEAINS